MILKDRAGRPHYVTGGARRFAAAAAASTSADGSAPQTQRERKKATARKSAALNNDPVVVKESGATGLDHVTSHVSDSDAQSIAPVPGGGGSSSWSVSSGLAPYRPNMLAVAVRTAAATTDAELHAALQVMHDTQRNQHDDRVALDTTRANEGYNDEAGTIVHETRQGIQCLAQLDQAFGVDSCDLVERALALEAWLGLSGSQAHSRSSHRDVRSPTAESSVRCEEVPLEDVEAILGQPPDKLFELFVRIGAHDMDDPSASAIVARYLSDELHVTSSNVSYRSPDSHARSGGSRRQSRVASSSSIARCDALLYMPVAQLPWFSADESNRARFALPLTLFLRDTLAMPRVAAVCLVVYAFPGLGLSVHSTGAAVVPPGTRLDFMQFSDVVNLYRFLLSRHDDSALQAALTGRVTQLLKKNSTMKSPRVPADTTEGPVTPRAHKRVAMSGPPPDSSEAPLQLAEDSDGDEPLALSFSVRQDSKKLSFVLRQMASPRSSHKDDVTPRASAAKAHVGFDTVPSIIDAISTGLGPSPAGDIDAQAVEELQRRVTAVIPPPHRPFPGLDGNTRPSGHHRASFARPKRDAVPGVPSRLLLPSFTGVEPTLLGAHEEACGNPTSSCTTTTHLTKPFLYRSLKTRANLEPVYDPAGLPSAVPAPPPPPRSAAPNYFTSNPWIGARRVLGVPPQYPPMAAIAPSGGTKESETPEMTARRNPERPPPVSRPLRQRPRSARRPLESNGDVQARDPDCELGSLELNEADTDEIAASIPVASRRSARTRTAASRILAIGHDDVLTNDQADRIAFHDALMAQYRNAFRIP